MGEHSYSNLRRDPDSNKVESKKQHQTLSSDLHRHGLECAAILTYTTYILYITHTHHTHISHTYTYTHILHTYTHETLKKIGQPARWLSGYKPRDLNSIPQTAWWEERTDSHIYKNI